MNFGPKSLVCLRLAAITPAFGPEWVALYQAACLGYSAKAVRRKLWELYRRGYVDYGVSIQTARLTEKGCEVLAAATPLLR